MSTHERRDGEADPGLIGICLPSTQPPATYEQNQPETIITRTLWNPDDSGDFRNCCTSTASARSNGWPANVESAL